MRVESCFHFHEPKENTVRKKFYPVIHCIGDVSRDDSFDHALVNSRIALHNGADGVFLIGHSLPAGTLREIYAHVRENLPEAWIGVNFLDLPVPSRTFALLGQTEKCAGLNALWIDGLPEQRLDIPRSIQVFGGIAFKYINPNLSGKSLQEACAQARRSVDVATTSGEKTGSPPSPEKLQVIRMLLGEDTPLAVASGVDAGNADTMTPYADIFMVASSVTERDPERGGHEYLVPEKVRKLADVFHSYEAE
jgi:hypothetical protein